MNELSKLQRIDYEDYRKMLHTGDIVLFSGTGAVSEVIKRASDSPWTHIGRVIQDGTFGQVLLWESTSLSPVKDINDNRVKVGVQTVSLSTRIALYEGVVGIRRLSNFPMNADRLSTLIHLRRKFRNRPYEKDMLEMAAAAIDSDWPIIKGLVTNTTDLSSIFCSELSAELDMGWLLLPSSAGDEPSNEYTPGDYGDGRKCEKLYAGCGVKIERTVIVKG